MMNPILILMVFFIAEAIYPEKFVGYVRGHVMVHEWAGFTSFVPDPNGPHRIGDTIGRTLLLSPSSFSSSSSFSFLPFLTTSEPLSSYFIPMPFCLLNLSLPLPHLL